VARLLQRRDLERRVLVEDQVGKVVAACVVANDARAARVQQRLARSREGVEKNARRSQVIRVGCVDDAVGIPALAHQHVRIVQVADHGLDSACPQQVAFGLLSHETPHAVAGGDEASGHAAADIATGAGDENLHFTACSEVDLRHSARTSALRR
jgi:hypothetical protein